MSKLEQAARQALEALREYRDTQMISAPRKAIEALREALDGQAAADAEYRENICRNLNDLTDEELWEAAKTAKSNDLTDAFRAVITADREKNK